MKFQWFVMTLSHIYLRLTEIFASKCNFPLQELQSLQLEIFYNWHQLQVDQFTLNMKIFGIIRIHCRGFLNFEIAELTEVVREREDDKFINLLNRVRTAETLMIVMFLY